MVFYINSLKEPGAQTLAIYYHVLNNAHMAFLPILTPQLEFARNAIILVLLASASQ